MDIFRSYASCHIGGTLPCLVWPFFSLLIFCKMFSFTFSCGVDSQHISSFFLLLCMKSLPIWTSVWNLWKRDLSRPLYCWTPKLCAFLTDSCCRYARRGGGDLRPKKCWSHFFLFLRPCLKGYVCHRQQSQYLLYRSFPLGVSGFCCHLSAFIKVYFLSSGILDLPSTH